MLLPLWTEDEPGMGIALTASAAGALHSHPAQRISLSRARTQWKAYAALEIYKTAALRHSV